jgi:GntR family transcriptional regulator, gluconate operon transcriptional repressor
LEVIERQPLKYLVARQLKEAIMAGDLKPGQRLTESSLGKKLHVSQATVREALIELEHRGFVDRPRPRITCVAIQTRRDAEEIYAVRVPLETLVIDNLAKKRVNLDESKKAAQQMLKAAKAGNLADFVVADFSFHRALWKAAENSHLEQILVRLVGRGFAFSLITARQRRPTSEKLKAIGELHVQLVGLIRDGKVAEAKRTLKASMDRTWMEEVNLTDAETLWPECQDSQRIPDLL